MTSPSTPIPVRFWRKVDIRSIDECWPWLKSVRGSGSVKHGQFWVPPGALDNEQGWMAQAHCVAFRLVHGRWPEPQGLHGCDNGVCCNVLNPAHVHEGTARDNIHEMFARGRARPQGRIPVELRRRQELYAEYVTSGLSQRAFAEQSGISIRMLERILREVRNAAA